MKTYALGWDRDRKYHHALRPCPDITRPARYLYCRCLRRWSSPASSAKLTIRLAHLGQADERHRT